MIRFLLPDDRISGAILLGQDTVHCILGYPTLELFFPRTISHARLSQNSIVTDCTLQAVFKGTLPSPQPRKQMDFTTA